MNKFILPLYLEPTGKGQEWKTAHEFCYEIGAPNSKIIVCVPEGFVTNLASVPRVLWPIIPPHGSKYAPACVLHDYLCEWPGFRRAMADAIFYEALRALGVGAGKAFIMWSGVRSFHILSSFVRVWI